jgi:hypothetical protein
MARMAPSWTSTANVLFASLSRPKKCCRSRRCPVEETGRNSVIPSTKPRNAA